jgi:hypothetical protein
MTKMRLAMSAGIALFAMIAAACADDQIEENVSVESAYLTDSDGYNYGAEYWLDSTVNEQVCVSPFVVARDNVNGDVAGPFLLEPQEKHVSIGSFISADQSQPWSVEVHAKWKRGTC